MRGMDNEALKEQITAQVRAQFEGQLREMKRQKNQVEEEFDNASDLWRAERRRLKSEIERLENELSESGRSPSGAESKPDQSAWEQERTRLTSELRRVEGALADAIARSSNPTRSIQAVRDEYEVRLAEANNLRFQTEREFQRAKVDWEDEKARLTRELRQLAAAATATRAYREPESAAEARIRELEMQLREARTTSHRSNDAAAAASESLAAAKKELLRLNTALADTQGQIDSGAVQQLRDEYEAKIQALMHEKDRLSEDLAASSTVDGPSQAGAPMQTASIHAEVRRVEASITAIEKLFDDPDTTVTAIARKRAEKAELEAYRRGLLFQPQPPQ